MDHTSVQYALRIIAQLRKTLRKLDIRLHIKSLIQLERMGPADASCICTVSAMLAPAWLLQAAMRGARQ